MNELKSRCTRAFAKYRWAFIACGSLLATYIFLGYIGRSHSHITPQIDSWESPASYEIDSHFRPKGWKKLNDKDFALVKEQMNDVANQMLSSRTFIPLSTAQKLRLASTALTSTKSKKAYLVRGVYYGYWMPFARRGFEIYTSKKRVMVSHGTMGDYNRMRRKALIVMLDFAPTHSYCDAGTTV